MYLLELSALNTFMFQECLFWNVIGSSKVLLKLKQPLNAVAASYYNTRSELVLM